jgi:hypothetical protein
VAPFQLGSDAEGVCRLLVHATVLAALGRARPEELVSLGSLSLGAGNRDQPGNLES